jgi:hypothetical protein
LSMKQQKYTDLKPSIKETKVSMFDVTDIILTLIALAAAAISAFLIPWIKSRTFGKFVAVPNAVITQIQTTLSIDTVMRILKVRIAMLFAFQRKNMPFQRRFMRLFCNLPCHNASRCEVYPAFSRFDPTEAGVFHLIDINRYKNGKTSSESISDLYCECRQEIIRPRTQAIRRNIASTAEGLPICHSVSTV